MAQFKPKCLALTDRNQWHNLIRVIHDLFNIIDGTSEPDERFGKWTEICFVDKTDELAENLDFLHDELYEKYWDWRKIRPENGWKLDNFEGEIK